MMVGRNWILAAALGVVFFGGWQGAWGAEKSPPIGEPVAQLSFKDAWYLPRSLDDLAEHKALVIAFTQLDCAASKAVLPELKRLEEKYRSADVQFLNINVGPKDSIRQIAACALEFEIPFPSVKDLDGGCARACGVDRTPAIVVLDAQRRLRYRGRCDDGLAADGAPRAATCHDLAVALDDLLAGREIAVAETEATGSPIKSFAESTTSTAAPGVNFAEHIAPLFAKHCQSCHQPNTEAPFALTSYDDVASHAETIVEVVREGRMPPWYASFGDFANANELSDQEQELVTRWVRAGLPPGDLSKVPQQAAPTRKSKWRIHEPDVVISTKQTHKLPATGYVPYKYVLLPYAFKHDTWVQEMEILPSNPRVVHHCNMAYIMPGGDWTAAKFVMGKVPGVQPMLLGDNIGFRIPKGAVLILQIHYTTTGQEEECQIEVGMRHAREVLQKEFHYLWMVDNNFAIPPGDPAHRVVATSTLDCDAIAQGAFAHMHFRGKDMSFTAHYPDGKSERLLTIPNYSFDWQLAYRWEQGTRRFPKGTQIECVAHYDNSTFNPFNPDPKATVREGQQTFQEMLNGVFFYIDASEHLNLHIDPLTGAVLPDEPKAAEQAAK